MKKNIEVFKAIKIIKPNKDITQENLISNFFLEAEPNKPIAFLFTKNDVQETLINILSGKDKNYQGFFSFENDIYFKNKKSKDIKNIVSLNKISWIQELNPNSKWIDVFVNSFNSVNSNHINEIYTLNHKLDNLNRKKMILDSLKIKNNSIIEINNEIKKIIDATHESIEKLHHATKSKNIIKVEKIYFEFINLYKNYLKRRILLLNKRNYQMMKILLDIDSLEKNKQNEIIKKIDHLEKEIDLIKKTSKNKIEAKLLFENNNKLKEELNRIYKKNKNFMLILKNDFIFFDKQHTYLLKNKNSDEIYVSLLNKIIIKSINKKNILKIAYLDDEQIKEIKNEIDNFYHSSLYSLNSIIEKVNYKKTRHQLKNDLNSIFIDYQKKSDFNKKELEKEYEEKLQKNKDLILDKIHDSKELEIQKMELQNIYDEYNWEKNNLISDINKKIEIINENYKEDFKEYNELSKEIYKKLIQFFNVKNNFIKKNNNKFTKNDFVKINDKFFASKMIKYKSLYNKQKEEGRKINNLLLNSKTSNDKNYFIFQKQLMKKYFVYNEAKELDINFFELEEKTGISTNLLKSKMLLLKSLIEMKKISILNNSFLLLKNEVEFNELLPLYKKILREKNMIWLIFDEHIDALKEIVEDVYIFKNSRMIEFGNINELFNNPIYNETANLLHSKKINDLKHKMTLENNFNDLDIFKKCDNYKIKDNHYVFANMESIYEYMKFVPQEFEWTNNKIKLEEFTNEINFKKEMKNLAKDIVNQENEEEKEKETVIIDVRKEFNKLKSNNK